MPRTEGRPRYGSHLSVAGGLHLAVEEAKRLGLRSLQVFTRNQRQWNAPPLRDDEIAAFHAARKAAQLDSSNAVVSHNSYLINLASPDAAQRRRSIGSQRAELERCEALGIEACVLHPGAHLGTPRKPREPNRLGEPPTSDEQKGLARITASVQTLIRETRGARVCICLETTTGSGTNLGYDFAHLGAIIDSVHDPERVGVCIDTCHIVAAGYDMSTAQRAADVLGHLDATVGLGRVRVVHLNDSAGSLASRLDRHAHIGQGCCGDACFRSILTHPELVDVPMILETPKDNQQGGKPWDSVNIAALERIRKRTVRRTAALALAALCMLGVLGEVGCASRRSGAASGETRQSAAPSGDPTPSEQRQLNDATKAMADGRHDDALQQFQAILKDNPMLPEAFIGVGDVRYAQGRFSEAEPNYRRAAALDPQDFNAQFGLGRSLQMLGRNPEAITAYHRALIADPDSALANANMATAYLSLGDAAVALQFGERAVALDPKDGAAHVNLGVAYERVGRPADAIAQYQAAAELLPVTPQLLINLVNASVGDGRFQEAIATAQTLTRLSDRPESFERLGWALFRAGNYNESEVAYRQAAALDATYWPAWNGIGVNNLNAWLNSDKRDSEAGNEARRAFRASLKANPDQPKIIKLFTTYGL